MRRKANNYLIGILIFFLVVTFITVFNGNSIYVLENSNPSVNEEAENYLDEQGEPTDLTLKCQTCVLIGTSGHLLKGGKGSEIDDFPCIFRLGFSPSRGFEEHVGMRTTVRVVDSFRFYPFLKKPTKLVTGPYGAENWVLFDRNEGDITRFHAPILNELLQRYDTRFYWFSKKLERELRNSLEQRTNVNGHKISALWFATRVIEDAGCSRLSVYGIPDYKICKRSMNLTVPSVYWEKDSADWCLDGVDASFRSQNTTSTIAIVPSVAERRAIDEWGDEHSLSIKFKFPSW